MHEGARPARITLQPINEGKRVMSNQSRGTRGQSIEPYDASYEGQQLMQQMPYEQHQQNVNSMYRNNVNTVN